MKFFIYLMMSLLLFTGCAHKTIVAEKEEKNVKVVSIRNIDFEVAPGQLKLITFTSKLGARLICDGSKDIRFRRESDRVSFFWGESYFSKKKGRLCYFEDDDRRYVRILIKVINKEYQSEVLSVNKKRVTLNEKDRKRAELERRELKVIYEQSDIKALFSEGFSLPLKSKITSHYGKKRVFNGVRKSQHLGVDLRGRIGTPVPVSNRGVVVFAGHLFYSGNTVVVDHGLGLFTTYGHLSKIIAKTGEVIKKYDFVGLVGNTGRVTGPHLHWGLKVHGNWVDAMTLVDETININW